MTSTPKRLRTRAQQRIQARREELGLSRPELARRLRITRAHVWRVETGVQPLSLRSLPRWARALDLDARTLAMDLVS